MSYGFNHHTLMPLAFLFLSLLFVAFGLYVLARGRPFMIDARWMLLVLVVAFAPQVIMMLSLFFVEERHRSLGLDFMSWLALLSTAVLFGFIAMQNRGYMVFGTTQESLREALLSALSSLGLKSEETLSSIRLPSVPAELQVADHGWVGTGQLRLRNGGRPGLLVSIAEAMNAYFDTAKVKTNMITAVFYLIAGLLLGAMSVTMLINFR